MEPTVFVVDDDPAVSRALAGIGPLLSASVASYPTANAFLEAYDPQRPGCLILDLRMPGMSGMELQKRLAERNASLPIVMISGHADVRTAVEAMSRGAVTLLEKPFRLEDLLRHVRRGLEQDALQRAARSREAEFEARMAQLTAKEREVLAMVVAGKTNKQMAAELNLSLRAVEDRRGRLMSKLGAKSLAELLQRVPPAPRI